MAMIDPQRRFERVRRAFDMHAAGSRVVAWQAGLIQ
jgi:hypothetical protein